MCWSLKELLFKKESLWGSSDTVLYIRQYLSRSDTTMSECIYVGYLWYYPSKYRFRWIIIQMLWKWHTAHHVQKKKKDDMRTSEGSKLFDYTSGGKRCEPSRAGHKDFKLCHLWRTSLCDSADKRGWKERLGACRRVCFSLLIWTSILMGHLTLIQKLDLETRRVPPSAVTLLPEQGNGSHCGHQKCITYAPLSAQHSHQRPGLLSALYLTDSGAVCRLKRNRAVKNWVTSWSDLKRKCMLKKWCTVWQCFNFTEFSVVNMSSPMLKLKWPGLRLT